MEDKEDIYTEELMSLRELSQKVGVVYNTIRNYSKNGFAGVSGVVVVLETVNTPQGKQSSVKAYQRFIRRLNDRSYGTPKDTSGATHG
jgi:hypothetical protein